MFKSCAVTGSFDPITLGHVDLVNRAKAVFDKVYVLMLVNPEKNYAFSKEERLKMLRAVFDGCDGVEVCFYDGYTADFCKPRGIEVLIRGVRDEKDFEYEKQLAKANYDYGGLTTYFLYASEELLDVSSSGAKKALNSANLEAYMPKEAIAVMKERTNE